MSNEITQKDFEAYEAVRASGVTNMFAINIVQTPHRSKPRKNPRHNAKLWRTVKEIPKCKKGETLK